MNNHAIKIESVEIDQSFADQLEETLKDFLKDLNYSDERIEQLECRRRDGFIPHSHNKGGLGAIAFMMQSNAEQWIHRFKNASKTLEKYYQYDVEYFEKDLGIKEKDWTEEQREKFYEARNDDSEATVLFSADLMYQGIERGIHSLNIRLCVCVQDAPYHRKYDDLIDIDVNFRTISGLKNQLKKILKQGLVPSFANALMEAY